MKTLLQESFMSEILTFEKDFNTIKQFINICLIISISLFLLIALKFVIFCVERIEFKNSSNSETFEFLAVIILYGIFFVMNMFGFSQLIKTGTKSIIDANNITIIKDIKVKKYNLCRNYKAFSGKLENEFIVKYILNNIILNDEVRELLYEMKKETNKPIKDIDCKVYNKNT